VCLLTQKISRLRSRPQGGKGVGYASREMTMWWKLEKEQRNHQSAKADSFFVKEGNLIRRNTAHSKHFHFYKTFKTGINPLGGVVPIFL
jgi:hypothetical protein